MRRRIRRMEENRVKVIEEQKDEKNKGRRWRGIRLAKGCQQAIELAQELVRRHSYEPLSFVNQIKIENGGENGQMKK